MGNTRPRPSVSDGSAPDAAARDGTPVTLLPNAPGVRVTPAPPEKAKPDKGVSQPLPVLPMLPTENDCADGAARAHALLAETFERIAGWWVEGAELPPAELEGDIDRAVLAGDLGALRAALNVYEQAARERCSAARDNTPRTGGHGQAPQEG
jgi:hypothetical protein